MAFVIFSATFFLQLISPAAKEVGAEQGSIETAATDEATTSPAAAAPGEDAPTSAGLKNKVAAMVELLSTQVSPLQMRIDKKRQLDASFEKCKRQARSLGLTKEQAPEAKPWAKPCDASVWSTSSNKPSAPAVQGPPGDFRDRVMLRS